MVTRTLRPTGGYAYTVNPNTATEADILSLPFHYFSALSDMTRRVFPHKAIDQWRDNIGAVSVI